MYLLGVIVATIITVLIAVYVGVKKKEEPIVSKSFLKKEKIFEVEEPEIKKPERIIEQNQPQNRVLERQESESKESGPDSEQPFQPPSEPEVL
ncbi:MAG: hypothetical protein NTU58_03625 [Candidatus Nealsonbacteria bacterium]|nr:hypothetical protein [Candidatus Nealsonbacteria bacterium]